MGKDIICSECGNVIYDADKNKYYKNRLYCSDWIEEHWCSISCAVASFKNTLEKLKII